jgi:hypothetical protein
MDGKYLPEFFIEPSKVFSSNKRFHNLIANRTIPIYNSQTCLKAVCESLGVQLATVQIRYQALLGSPNPISTDSSCSTRL